MMPTTISAVFNEVFSIMATPRIGAMVAEMAMRVLYMEMIVVLFLEGVTSRSILKSTKTVPVMETPMMTLKRTNM